MLVLVSYPTPLSGEISFLKKLFDEGLEYFHLRKPDFSKSELVSFIESIPEKYHRNVIVHSHYDITKSYNLKGIHLKSKTDYSEINFSVNINKSKSCHSLREIEELDNSYYYAFLSPIFDSISKSEYSSKFDLTKLSEFFRRSVHKTKVIALGGIDSRNAGSVLDIGFAGIAMLGHIWLPFAKGNDQEAFNNYKRVRLLTQDLKKVSSES